MVVGFLIGNFLLLLLVNLFKMLVVLSLFVGLCLLLFVIGASAHGICSLLVWCFCVRYCCCWWRCSLILLADVFTVLLCFINGL